MAGPSSDGGPPHPKVRVSAMVAWYLRATAVAGGVLVVLLLGQRGLVLVPLLLVAYLLLARRSGRGWRVVLGTTAAYLTAELVWWVIATAAGLTGAAFALLALAVGIAVGVLIARAAPAPPPEPGDGDAGRSASER